MDSKHKGERGFSLIELLIVITIIAILTSVVLMSIQVARNKGYDNNLKSMMKQVINQAEIYRSSNVDNHFGKGISSLAVTNCAGGVFDDSGIDNLEQGILKNAAVGATLSCTTDSTGSNWSMMVSSLRGSGTWCVDSLGSFKTAIVNTDGQCN